MLHSPAPTHAFFLLSGWIGPPHLPHPSRGFLTHPQSAPAPPSEAPCSFRNPPHHHRRPPANTVLRPQHNHRLTPRRPRHNDAVLRVLKKWPGPRCCRS